MNMYERDADAFESGYIAGLYANKSKEQILNDSILIIKSVCRSNNDCVHCPMNHNCNEQPAHWEVIDGNGT